MEKKSRDHDSGSKKTSTFNIFERSRFCRALLLPFITCFIFVIFWFILCPIFWSSMYTFSSDYQKPTYWAYLFWAIAFIVWMVIMVCLVCYWKYAQNNEAGMKRDPSEPNNSKVLKESMPPSYNSVVMKTGRAANIDDPEPSNDVTINLEQSDDLESQEDSKNSTEEDLESKTINSDSKPVKKPDLPPISVNQPINEEMDANSLQKSPLSPRDLFFIDMIREAEKAETLEKIDDKQQENASILINRESSYFIAEVNKPKIDKAEVFLEIGPENPQEPDYTDPQTIDLTVEIPGTESSQDEGHLENDTD